MLLLLTIALVLVAAITLLIGIIGDSLLLIFVSIFCSLGAGATLLVLSSASKKRARETAAPAAAGPAPLESTKAEEAKPVVGAEPVPTVPSPALAEEAPEPVAETRAPAPAAPAAAPDEFPIEGYDDLKVSEITPLLDDLDLDQLDMVLEREENNKKRATIMNRVNELMDRLEAEEEAAGAPAATEALEPAIPVGDAVATPPAAAAVGGTDAFPIADYDRLSVDDILDRLPELDDEELELVYEREDAGAGRTAILDRVDEILDEREGISPAAGQSEEVAQAEEAAEVTEELDAVAARKAPAKKVAVKKVAVKKAAAPKKVAVKKAAAPKKVAVKKAAAAKKAAPVKKAAVKKAAAATKTTAKKATAKKATPAKKAAKKSR